MATLCEFFSADIHASMIMWLCLVGINFGSGSGGRISWDRNSTFSGGRIFDHEIEIPNNELLQNWSGDRIGS
jgi:hypothetical protein